MKWANHYQKKEKNMYKKTLFVLLISIFLLSGCITADRGFVPAPPPVESENVMNISQISIGSDGDGQIMSITSPLLDVQYRENGDGAGKTATEVVTLPNGQNGTMLSVVWGDWTEAELTLVNYYGEGVLTSAMIVAEFDEISLFQLTTGNSRYTVDRSQVILVYEQSPSGELQLRQLQYVEKWGLGLLDQDELLYGGYAVWMDDFEDILPRSYLTWGFWEENGVPATQVRDILKSALRTSTEPEFEAVDRDSIREVIGRQTGLYLERDGIPWGKVVVEYSNTFGRQPNTELIGKGALSLIEWQLGEENYYLIILSPRISPVGNSLYIFTTDSEEVSQLANSKNANNPMPLYDDLRNGVYENVFLTLYAIGDIGEVTESSGDSTTHVGDSGGVQWRSIGQVDKEDVQLANNLLSLLGPGQYQMGLYYAYKPGSGSGMSYYLSTLTMSLFSDLNSFNSDIGLLDRVLVPNFDIAPFD
jgi:hypothetical protein